MNKLRRHAALALLAITLSIGGCYKLSGTTTSQDWTSVVEQIRPAVVKIYVGSTDIVTGRQKVMQMGSGFVYSPYGTVVTAKHVLEIPMGLHKPWVRVVFFDGTEYFAKFAIGSPSHDLAVIKIPAEGLPYLELESRELLDGQAALAMGSNSVSSWAVTDGIVSKVIPTPGSPVKELGYIQATTPINSGYSGGPLVNDRGKVIGISCLGTRNLHETYLFMPASMVNKLINEILDGSGNVRLYK